MKKQKQKQKKKKRDAYHSSTSGVATHQYTKEKERLYRTR